MIPGKSRINFGGNVSMQSSNEGMSCLTLDDQASGQHVITNKLKDNNSYRGGLSDATSMNEQEVLHTGSSMVDSVKNINTNQFLLTSPGGQRNDTNGSNFSGPGVLRKML